MRKTLIIVLAVLILSIVLVGCGHTHEWEPATCESPMVCKTCGETEGIALTHEWIESTCTEAKHCIHCGAIQGETIPHSWNEATCTEAKICNNCKMTEGEALGHTIHEWAIVKEASCSEEGERVGTCDRCAKECKESIEKLPHTEGEWEIKEDYIFNPDGTVKSGVEVIACTVCTEEIETREYSVELTLSQKNAVICAYDNISFWHCGPSFLIDFCLVDMEEYPPADAKFAVAHMDVDWDEQAVLYAKENCDGASKSGLASEMRHYGFDNDQIDKALKEIGY